VRLRLAKQPDLDGLRARAGALTLEWQAPVLDVRLLGKESIEAANAKLLRELLDQGVGILGLETGQSLEASYLASRRRD
jgi:hypothetical protein